MKNIIILLLGLLYCSTLFAKSNLIKVPNNTNPNAAFLIEDKQITAQADGATLVACNEVIIQANKGSIAQVHCSESSKGSNRTKSQAQNHLVIKKGTFFIIAGSKKITVELENTAQKKSPLLTVKQASVYISDSTSPKPAVHWQIKTLTTHQRLATELTLYKPVTVNPKPAEASSTTSSKTEINKNSAPKDATPSTAPTTAQTFLELKTDLKENRLYRLSNGSNGKIQEIETGPETVEAQKRIVLFQTIANPRQKTHVLKPQNIEHPNDFKAGNKQSDTALKEVEIEDIELEVGCVEVCVD